MAFQADQKVKVEIVRALGTEQLFRLLSDPDANVLMKTLGLLRNLLSTRPVTHIKYILYIYIYILTHVINALTQIPFNGTNFMQRVFSVWPVAQPIVGEMEMHSVANLAALQTPLVTFFP